MVLVSKNSPRRQSRRDVGGGDLYRRESSILLPMGEEMDEVSSQRSSSSSMNSSWSRSSRRSSFHEAAPRRVWTLSIVYIAAILSWTGRTWAARRTRELMTGFETELYWQEVQHSQVLASMTDIKKELSTSGKWLSKQKKSKKALEHEFRMIDELEEVGFHVWTPPKKSKDEQAKRWVHQRVRNLKDKIDGLKESLQRTSKAFVLNSFGEGPFRVEFTVEFTHPRQKSVNQSFTIETASAHEMPHSIHLFLDMVDSKVWDDTVFLHHEKVEHVLAAAPIDHESHLIKISQLHELGWDGLGFPEYSEKHPHKKFSVGFADRGPTFYINTMNNEQIHGPRGQGHHTLDEDADPCFAEVVDGFDVVEALINFGMLHSKLAMGSNSPWADEAHSWTHIVSVRLLN